MTETKTNQAFALAALLLASAALVLTAYSNDRGILVMMHYLCPAVFCFTGITLLAGKYRGQIDLWMGAAFTGWYVLSRILLKELYLDDSFGVFSNLCCVYLLAFPFAHCMDDGQKKNGLKAAAAVFAAGYGVLAWLGVLAACVQHSITLPWLGTVISFAELDFRLSTGIHPNVTACIFFVALLMGIWLITQLRSRLARLVVLVLCIGAYAGIALTDSRTVIVQTALFAAYMVFAAVLHSGMQGKRKRTVAALAAAAVSIVLVYRSFGLVTEGILALANRLTAHAEAAGGQLVTNRGVLNDMKTLVIRGQIYKDSFRLIQEQPRILLAGVRETELTSLIHRYTAAAHAHSAHLQTLISMGLPALLMALFFTVRAVWASVRMAFSKQARFSDRLLAGMLLAFLAGTLTEPYLFVEHLTIANMPFFLIFGYVLEAERALRK